MVQVVLGESDLSKVLVPISSKNGVKGSMEILWQNSVLFENSSEVELSSSVGDFVKEWEAAESRSNSLTWLETSEGKNTGAVSGKTLRAWVGGFRELLDHLVGEGGNLLARLLLHLRNNLDKKSFFWLSVHESPEGKHAEFWLILTVLVDWEKNLLNFAWHGVLEKSKSINSFLANWKWLALVNNDIIELVDGNVKSGVSNGLKSKNFLVDGFGILELLEEDAKELLLDLALILTDKWSHVFEVRGSMDNRSSGEPDRLEDKWVFLGNGRLGELDERLSDSLGWVWGLLD